MGQLTSKNFLLVLEFLFNQYNYTTLGVYSRIARWIRQKSFAGWMKPAFRKTKLHCLICSFGISSIPVDGREEFILNCATDSAAIVTCHMCLSYTNLFRYPWVISECRTSLNVASSVQVVSDHCMKCHSDQEWLHLTLKLLNLIGEMVDTRRIKQWSPQV